MSDPVPPALREYDREHGIESDAYADYEAEQRLENGGLPNKPNLYTIGVYFLQHDPIYISSREARCLAASLLRAADEADEGEDV